MDGPQPCLSSSRHRVKLAVAGYRELQKWSMRLARLGKASRNANTANDRQRWEMSNSYYVVSTDGICLLNQPPCS